MTRTLFRLVEDLLPPSFAPVYLPAAVRAIYVVDGAASFSVELAPGLDCSKPSEDANGLTSSQRQSLAP